MVLGTACLRPSCSTASTKRWCSLGVQTSLGRFSARACVMSSTSSAAARYAKTKQLSQAYQCTNKSEKSSPQQLAACRYSAGPLLCSPAAMIGPGSHTRHVLPCSTKSCHETHQQAKRALLLPLDSSSRADFERLDFLQGPAKVSARAAAAAVVAAAVNTLITQQVHDNQHKHQFSTMQPFHMS